jgi:RNA polymerase sigma factor (sigma-70 family)
MSSPGDLKPSWEAVMADSELSRVPTAVVEGRETPESARWYARLSDFLARIARKRVKGNLAALVGPTDFAQDAATAVFKNIGRFVRRGPGSTRAWVSQVLRNEIANRSRRKDVQKRATLPSSLDVAGAFTAPEERAMHVELDRRVKARLDDLDPKDRRIVELRYFEGKKFKEISQELNLPISTLHARLENALRYLGDDKGVGHGPAR